MSFIYNDSDPSRNSNAAWAKQQQQQAGGGSTALGVAGAAAAVAGAYAVLRGRGVGKAVSGELPVVGPAKKPTALPEPAAPARAPRVQEINNRPPSNKEYSEDTDALLSRLKLKYRQAADELDGGPAGLQAESKGIETEVQQLRQTNRELEEKLLVAEKEAQEAKVRLEAAKAAEEKALLTERAQKDAQLEAHRAEAERLKDDARKNGGYYEKLGRDGYNVEMRDRVGQRQEKELANERAGFENRTPEKAADDLHDYEYYQNKHLADMKAEGVDPDELIPIIHGGNSEFIKGFLKGEKGYKVDNPMPLDQHKAATRGGIMAHSKHSNRIKYYAETHSNRYSPENPGEPAALTGWIPRKYAFRNGDHGYADEYSIPMDYAHKIQQPKVVTYQDDAYHEITGDRSDYYQRMIKEGPGQ